MKIELSNGKCIADYAKPYVIAEIGANHNGDIALAKKMIDTAKACGADAVKFQSWTPDSLVSESEYRANQHYADSPKKHFGSLREMVEKYYLKSDEHHELARYCDEVNIDFNSTPFSCREIDLLVAIDVPFFKIASMDITNISLIKYAAERNKPVMLSTGMASMGEIETAIQWIESVGNQQIVLLHCISIYPPENKDIHLNNIITLRNAFGYPVGLSDHSIGFAIPLASVALGACVIEKHFTLDKDMPGWDHAISADPDELRVICRDSKVITDALGSFRRTVSEAEQEKKLKFRRSAVAAHDLQPGHLLVEEDILYKRPGTGILQHEACYLLGRRLSKSIQADELIHWDSLE